MTTMQTRKKRRSIIADSTESPPTASSLAHLIVTIPPDVPSSSSSPVGEETSASPRDFSKSAAERRFRWEDDTRMTLIKICHKQQVWNIPYGQTEQLWDSIAEELNSRLPSTSVPANGRGCQKEFFRLIKVQRGKESTAEARSGDVEPYTEREQLLVDCIQLTDATEAQKEKKKQQQAQYQAQVNATQTRLQQHSMSVLSKRSFTSLDSPSSSSSSSSSSCSSPHASTAHIVTAASQEEDESDVEEIRRAGTPVFNKRVQRDKLLQQHVAGQQETHRIIQETSQMLVEQLKADAEASNRMQNEIAHRRDDIAEQMASVYGSEAKRTNDLLAMFLARRG